MMTWKEADSYEDPEFHEFQNSLMVFKNLKNKNIKNFLYSADFKLEKDIKEEPMNCIVDKDGIFKNSNSLDIKKEILKV